MVLKAQNFQFSTNVALAYNVWWYEIVADLRAMQYQPSTNFKRSEND